MYTLITAASSAEAYSLKNALDSDMVLLGDYLDLPEILVRSGKMLSIPNPNSVSYTHQVLALCLDKDIDIIYPLRESEKELLLNAIQLFREYGIDIVADHDKVH